MKGEVDLKFSEKVVLNIDGGNKKNVWAIVFPDRDYFFQVPGTRQHRHGFSAVLVLF